METPGERMKYYVEKMVGLSIPDFADTVDVEAKTIYNIVNNKLNSPIGRTTLKKVLLKYPKFPVKWIQHGGDRPSDDTARMSTETQPNHEDMKAKDREIELLNKEIVFLNGRIKALERDNDRLYGQIVSLEE